MRLPWSWVRRSRFQAAQRQACIAVATAQLAIEVLRTSECQSNLAPRHWRSAGRELEAVRQGLSPAGRPVADVTDTDVACALAGLHAEIYAAVVITPVVLGHGRGAADLTDTVTARVSTWAAREVTPLLEALRLIYRQMTAARDTGEAWAAAWLAGTWTRLPLPVRAAAGDTEAAECLAEVSQP